MAETNQYVNPLDNTGSITRIDKEIFLSLIGKRSAYLLSLSHYLEIQSMGNKPMTRPLLGALISEAAQMEELLDAYGARNNREWYPFRHLVAATKLYADQGYKILHIQHSLDNYRLNEIEGNIKGEVEKTLLFVGDVIMIIAERLMREADKLGLPAPAEIKKPERFDEILPKGCLPHDRAERHLDSAEEIITYIASEFLNLASESKFLHAFKVLPKEHYYKLIPDTIREENLRQIENKFHTLQSIYDTYLSGTDKETSDMSLQKLRGNISIIYHLIEVATGFTHYYERNIQISKGDTTFLKRSLVNPESLLNRLVSLSILFSSRYLDDGCKLCRDMIKRYTQIEEIELPVPKYRGFHVRPSTMIAKIVHHYGSSVKMKLGKCEYDAGAPLELFRANEEINAVKRRKLANEITHMNIDLSEETEKNMIAAVRKIVLELADMQKLVIYEQPLPLEELQPKEGETLSQFAADEIARMLAMGKIDIESDVTVTFIGDKRPLTDIRLLAEHGYGEDSFGNNIPLPEKLLYLRR